MMTLCMIVKDEAETIADTLESVKPFIDEWHITDTGSKDDTRLIIQNVLYDKPGTLWHAEFTDFATTRNAALAKAFEYGGPSTFVKTLAPWVRHHVLCLDADDCLYGGEHLQRAIRDDEYCVSVVFNDDSSDFAPAFMVECAQGSVTWDSCRLVSAEAWRKGWRYRGAVHEVLCGPNGERAPGRVEGCRIKHTPSARGAERSRARWERDVEILSKQNDPRSVFYLAMTLMWLEEWEMSANVFATRLTMNGWAEEKAAARFYFAACEGRMGNDPIPHYLGAVREYPHRAEALLELERLCPERAAEYRERRLAIPRPTGALFLDERAYHPRCPSGAYAPAPCCANPAADPQPCPYAEELGGDETPCRCCDACRTQCADDI